MIWPDKERCARCWYRGGLGCCPQCMYPEAPNNGRYITFCPEKEAKRIAEQAKLDTNQPPQQK